MTQFKIFLTSILASVLISTSQAAPKTQKAEAKKPVVTSETALFAGGCFWSLQGAFDHVPGVTSTLAGYAGGKVANPTYEQVCEETTGHAEAVEVVFDPQKISYEKLVDVYWHNVDPTTKDQSFYDHGSSYRSVIFYKNAEQKKIAEASKSDLEKKGVFKKPIVTEITAALPFYKAEDYHQHYSTKNPDHYQSYRSGSGRDKYFKSIWGPSQH